MPEDPGMDREHQLLPVVKIKAYPVDIRQKAVQQRRCIGQIGDGAGFIVNEGFQLFQNGGKLLAPVTFIRKCLKHHTPPFF